jgi:hypothetical protein
MAVHDMLERRLSLCLVLAAIVLLPLASAAFAQDSWEGNAAVIRRGEFSSPGLFAASDAFPLNSRVQVTNLQTGRQVDVTVLRRAGGAGTIFLLLSEEAAAQIGLSESEVARVRAALAAPPEVQAPEPTGESPYSSDPDLNPAASLDEQQIAAAESQPTTPAGPLEPVPQAAPAVEAASPAPEAETPALASLPPSQQEATPEGIPEGTPEAGATEQPAGAANEGPAVEPPTPPAVASQQPAPSAEQMRLEQLSERLPQKQLFLPPHRQTLSALPAPAGEEVAAAGETVEEPPVESVPAVAELEEETPPAVVEEPQVMEAPAAGQQPAEEPPIVSMVAPPGGEPQEDVEVELPGPGPAAVDEPTAEGTRLASPEEEAPLPPSTEMPIAGVAAVAGAEPEAAAAPTISEEHPSAAPEAVTAPEPAAATVARGPVVEATALAGLPRRSYFVQLGAYSTKGLAEKLASQLGGTYEVIVLAADSGGRLFYKVLVGPLNRDESGTLLYQFRARGFKDAFVRYVE